MIYEGTGVVYEYLHAGATPRDTLYASVTAPRVQRIEVRINDSLWDVVYAGAGGSHSWWTNAGGKLLPPGGLARGARLRIVSDGPVAFRIDWHE